MNKILSGLPRRKVPTFPIAANLYTHSAAGHYHCSVIMAALRSRCGHYIFVLFLSFFLA